jgi:hypothetical protein
VHGGREVFTISARLCEQAPSVPGRDSRGALEQPEGTVVQPPAGGLVGPSGAGAGVGALQHHAELEPGQRGVPVDAGDVPIAVAGVALDQLVVARQVARGGELPAEREVPEVFVAGPGDQQPAEIEQRELSRTAGRE